MKILRKKILAFYNTCQKDDGHGTHVSSITSLIGEDLILGLLEHYWENVHQARMEILKYICTTGKKKGPHLDAWVLKVQKEEKQLFQVEIKNWGANAIGGTVIPEGALNETILPEAKNTFEKYLKDPKVTKVFETMKKPRNAPVESDPLPLIAVWSPVSNSDQLSPYFVVSKYSNRQPFHVFSASLYLRSLSSEYVDIKSERVDKRMERLTQMIEM